MHPAILKAYRLVRHLPYAGWRTLAALGHTHTTLSTPYGPPLVISRSDWRAYWISRRPGFQQDTMRVWRTVASIHPDLAIDIGANYGEFAGAVCDAGFRVVCVEPNPLLIACLKRSFAGLDNVELVPAALGDKPGRAVLNFNASYSGGGSLGGEVIAHASAPSTISPYIGGNIIREEVEMTTFDLLPGVRSAKSLVFKMDIEGHEPHAFAGMVETLGRLDWWYGIIEYNARAMQLSGNDHRAFWKMLRNYRGAVIDRNLVDVRFLRDLPETPPGVRCDVLVAGGAP